MATLYTGNFNSYAMSAVGKNATDYVFNSLFAIAEKELPGIRYSKVIEGLTDGIMVA